MGIPEASAFRGARVALFQLETPLASVEGALRVARKEGAITMLDPAPAQPLTSEMLECVDIFTPNESEAASLPTSIARTAFTVILKLGAQGCAVYRNGERTDFPGFTVEAVDTTAAGDTFNAALACALSEDQPLDRAIRFASAAAALSVTKLGAQSSAPTRAEVEAFLRSGSVLLTT